MGLLRYRSRGVGYQITDLRLERVGTTPELAVSVEVDGRCEGAARVPSPCDSPTSSSQGDRVSRIEDRTDPGSIEKVLNEAVTGRVWASIEELDRVLARLGKTLFQGECETRRWPDADVILATSMAAARGCAARDGMSLHQWLPRARGSACLPIPSFHVVRGGADAPNFLDFRCFSITPVGAPSFSSALDSGNRIYRCLARVLEEIGFHIAGQEQYGFAPALQAPEDVLDLLEEAIKAADYVTGPDGIALEVDVGATELLRKDGTYCVNGTVFDATDLADHLAYLVDRYPILSITDGMAHTDREGWRVLNERLGRRIQLATNEAPASDLGTSERAPDSISGVARCHRLALHGTVTETIRIATWCRDHGGVVLGIGPGQGEDSFIADLGVAIGGGQISVGAPIARTQAYGRLLAIEEEAPYLPFGDRRVS
jgi:enolase